MTGPDQPSIVERLSRRSFGLVTVGAAAGLVIPAGAANAALPPDLLFDVMRSGDKIGFHRVAFKATEGGFVATTEIELAVKLAFVTVFRYRQTSADTWQDGRLVALRSSTDDDGKKTTVAVDRQGERLTGKGPRGAIDMPLGIMSDLSWWNEGIMKLDRVLDAQNGGGNPLKIKGPAAEALDVRGASTQTRRYEVVMGSKHTGSSWYDQTGRWVRTLLRTKGEELDYRISA